MDGQKQGGNVASYFCLADGTVIHAVAGPVDAQTFLREARWAVDLRKLAVTESRGDVARYRATIRRGHLERLRAETGHNLPPNTLPRIAAQAPPTPQVGLLQTPAAQALGRQGQVHLLLAYFPLSRLDETYPIVFEQVLGEKTSTLPVAMK
ncbi:MAG: hypothetical protein JWO38_6731 [Gemmataceae bacterium]|nr:hypothetical protein [Gemmataceae bacterium]